MARSQVVLFIDRIFAVLFGLTGVFLLLATIAALFLGVAFIPLAGLGIIGIIIGIILGLLALYYLLAAKLMWNLEGHRTGLFFLFFTVLTGIALLADVISFIGSLVMFNAGGVMVSLFEIFTTGYIVARLMNWIRG